MSSLQRNPTGLDAGGSSLTTEERTWSASAPTRECLELIRPFGRLLEDVLLRKEVIQPHLPVRLPCYDFTPITDPTFDGSLP